MKAEAVLADLLSGDPHRIWRGAGAVAAARDRAALQVLAGQAEAIRQATRRVDLGGILRPNRATLDFALRKLAVVAEGDGCLCGLYPDWDLYLPDREAAAGHVDILERRDDHDTWSGQFRCRCRDCGRLFAVTEQHGYHYPWARWLPEAAS